MFALCMDRHEVIGFQAVQMRASRRRSNIANNRKLGTGSSAAVKQADKHSGARRLSDGRSHPGYRDISRFDIHYLTIAEVFVHDNAHTGTDDNRNARRERLTRLAMLVGMGAMLERRLRNTLSHHPGRGKHV